MPISSSQQSVWFAEAVQPHERMLRAWLKKRFSPACDIDDIVQESFVRVLRAQSRGELRSAKAFLFATARNLALDQARHRQIAAETRLVEKEVLAVLDEAGDVPEIVARRQEITFLTQAIQSLPRRCRTIFELRKIHGYSQKEIAVRLGISEHTVSAQLTIGLHKCMEFLSQRRGEGSPNR